MCVFQKESAFFRKIATKIEQGLEKGLEQGLKQGKQSEKIKTILRMIAKNVPIELIEEYPETSIQEIANLIEKNK